MLAQLPAKNAKACKIRQKEEEKSSYSGWAREKSWRAAAEVTACQHCPTAPTTRLMTWPQDAGVDELSWSYRCTTSYCGLECERHWSVISRSPWSHIHQDHCLPDVLAITCSHLVLRLSKWYLNHDLKMTWGPTVDYWLRRTHSYWTILNL